MNPIKNILFMAFFGLLCSASAQTRTMLKDASSNTLLEDFKTGSHKVTFSSTGTLEFISGFTVTGASYLRSAASLQAHSSALDVYAGISPSSDMQSFLGTANDSAARSALGVALGSDVQAWDAVLDAIAASTPATGVFYYNAGTVTYVDTSTGGNDIADAGKLALYDSNGQLKASRYVNVSPVSGDGYANYGADGFTISSGTNSISTALPALTSDVLLIWPVASGSLVGTGDSQTVNSAMLVPTGVTAATYGSATRSLTLAINAAGQITSASSQIVTPAESSVTFTDITTNNASTSKHGYLPKLTGSTTQYLNGNGAWSTPPSGITIGTTTTSGASADDILISNGSVVQKLTPGAGVKAAVAAAVNGTGGLLTYGIIGTSGATVPLLNGGNTFSGANTFSQDVTIATGKGLIMGSGSNYFRTDAYNSVLWDANCVIGRSNNNGGNQFAFENGGGTSYGLIYFGQTGVVNLNVRTSSYVLDVTCNGHAANAAIYNSWSSDTSWEAFMVDWKTSSNECHTGTQVGSGGGTARDLFIMRGGVDKFKAGAATNDSLQPLKLPSYIVSGLPSASTCGAGTMAFVTDATSTTAYTTVSGGGSSKVLVISDGTNWIVH